MLKRIIASLLALILIFSFAACNKEKKPAEEIVVPEKKVAILVAPEAQYPEDYRAAAAIAAKYPDKVIVKEYPDSRILKPGDPQIMEISRELANDSEIGAIIYARATQFTVNAINAAKAINPDLVTVCVEPEESVEKISAAANLVLCADWAEYGKAIVAQAKAQGAEHFVMFSFTRHINDNPLVAAQQIAIKAACEEQGIAFAYENSLDPTFSGGFSQAELFIREAVARLTLNERIKGENVVLFSTDSAVQSTLIDVANNKGYIYVSPSFPTAYNGLGEYYEIAMPEDNTDVAAYIENAKAAIAADTEGKARFAMYNYPLATTLVKSAVYCAFDILNGKTTAENMAERVAMRVTDAATGDTLTVKAYNDKLTNVYAAYSEGYVTVK